MVMEIADKYFKRTILNVLHMFKKTEENKNMMGTEIKDLKKTQIKILKVKYTIFEIQNILRLTSD